MLQIIKDLVTLFPVIRDWIVEFLDDNKDMTASMVGRNMLIEQVSNSTNINYMHLVYLGVRDNSISKIYNLNVERGEKPGIIWLEFRVLRDKKSTWYY